MKTVMFVLSLCLVGFSKAQNKSQEITQPDSIALVFKSATSIESRFFPFSDQSINNLRFRFFGQDLTAIRMNFKLNHASGSNDRIEQDENGNDLELKTDSSETEFELSIGGEYHWRRGEKVSPYVGVDLLFGNKSTDKSREDYLTITVEELDEFGFSEEKEVKKVVKTEFDDFNNSGFTTVGLYGIVGVDFYMSERIYIGTELSLGISHKRYKRNRMKVGDETRTGEAPTAGPDTNWGTGSVANIRFGFFF